MGEELVGSAQSVLGDLEVEGGKVLRSGGVDLAGDQRLGLCAKAGDFAAKLLNTPLVGGAI